MATVLQAVGAVAISVGLGMMWLPLGVVAGGILTILFGLAWERRNAR